MKQLIIRADDIGYSEAVNYGILKSVKDGLVRSAGVMPNMVYAGHGADLLKGYDVCLGQHTNVCLGRPCADPEQIPSLLQENGEFRSSRQYREAFKNHEDFVNVEEAVIEIEAQYKRFKELTGREPAYFEAHAVMSMNLFKALEIVADKYDLPYQEMRFDGKPASFRKKPILVLPMGSMSPDYDPFMCLKDGILDHAREDMPNVGVYHPGYIDEYLLNNSSLTVNRTKEVTMLCDPAVKEWLLCHDVELVTYADVN
ncbi:MAG: ChbG/HpnK family deacetylase [Solobacterium sp.]|nr:ChbG/HpnK family deacetylase [Solobacterium sp.]